MSFTVAITGRPNVGKSTFFNRMLEQRKAIVDDISGVTRDRQYGVAEWSGRTFNVIDTGGFVAGSDDVFETEIRKQVHIAIDEAKQGLDVEYYMSIASGLQKLDPEDPKATIDVAWVDQKTKDIRLLTERLEGELKAYKNNLIKESIRVCGEFPPIFILFKTTVNKHT